MSERVTKIDSNRDHSHLAYNEIKSDNEGLRTLIRLSPEEAEYINSYVLAQSTVTNEDINTSKKRKRKTKKRQNRRTSKGNEEAEIVPSPWAFPKTSIDDTSTDDDGTRKLNQMVDNVSHCPTVVVFLPTTRMPRTNAHPVPQTRSAFKLPTRHCYAFPGLWLYRWLHWQRIILETIVCRWKSP